MSTKAPAGVMPQDPASLEAAAYAAVVDIETEEPNDRNRLGYQVWTWLRERNGSLIQAIRASGVRTRMPLEDVGQKVAARLEERGISIS